MLGTTISTCIEEWILDSTCSYHIFPSRNSFTSFDDTSSGTILIGNDHACEKKGVGVVKLKLHNGTTRELTNVWYIPNLKKNLIFLGALESNGFQVSIESIVLRVTRGALVVMKGLRRNHLYYLQGKTVVGGIATVETTCDTTKLWHMRLGHAGEKSMQGLVKQRLLKGAKTCKLDFCEYCVLGKQTKVKLGTIVH